MPSIKHNIISTGSKGNAVVINDYILIDCGVSLKALSDHKNSLRLVLLTHIHSDHFNKTTIKRLSIERPSLRFACCKWLVDPLIECGVIKNKIDVLAPNNIYDYGTFNISPFMLVHNVPNCGYKVRFSDRKMIYATDTNSLSDVTAKDYNLFLIEANYEDDEIQERIRKKQESGQYVYEYSVLENHLSKAKCDEFILNNAGNKSEYVYLHEHKEMEN